MAEAQHTEKHGGWRHMKQLLVQASGVRYSWVDWRKPLMRTKNKACIPVSKLVTSHCLSCSATTFLFRRLGRTDLSAMADDVRTDFVDLVLYFKTNQSWVPDLNVVDLDFVHKIIKAGPRPVVTRSQTWAGHVKAFSLAERIKPDTK